MVTSKKWFNLTLLLEINNNKMFVQQHLEGAIGVNYGRVADNLPHPTVVANLVQTLGIKNVKIYDSDATVLSAFANTGISVIVAVPNNEIVSLASSAAALTWVQTNVKNFFPATQITYILVGNEVLSGDSSIWPSLLPAMQQIYSALRFYSLDTNIKVSTPHALGVLAVSFPPSAGVFQPNIAASIMAPLLSFLSSTQSPFMINVYPYLAYLADGGQNIALNYALIEPGAVGVTDSNSGLHYSSLIDAQLDAIIYAMQALNFNNIPLILTESGWPSQGDPNEIGASVANAEIYNNNLVRHVTPLGTPLRPGVEIDTYIFALFNEDLKPGATAERNFGLYYPNLTQVYPINLKPTSSQFSTNLALRAIGVNYGRVADNLPQPTVVANLVQRLGIKHVKIYDSDATVLSAFANTGISVIVAVPNNEIVSLASSPSAALTWVQTNVKNFFPATQITYILVGNEVLSGDSSIWPSLLPAMQQIYSALRFYSLDTNIKVSTPHALGVLAVSFPPSAGVFQPNIAASIMAPLLSFLSSTQSPFMINVYPYLAYLADGGQNIALNYGLIEPGAVGFTDSNSGLHYSSLIDAMLDAIIYAMQALNFNNIPLILTESGWPSEGDPNEIGASVANAEIYNNNLVRHVTVAQPLGTPLRPGVEIDTYIFELFNEDLKAGATSERNFGLYYPNLTQVYPINLNPTSCQFSTNLAC
ncbi:unnamed protein product [Sphagnum jensenii]|uniref:Beta-1,3-glucanase n=1 Tax=Sphagnum jensenii TaxID=128206 RepID=A0ABP1B2E1_9BRYO